MINSKMSANDILFDPIVKSTPVSDGETGIIRRSDEIRVEELKLHRRRALYTDVTHEIMNRVVRVHGAPSLIDVRTVVCGPQGSLDLTGIVNRYYDGDGEMWVSRPRHMPADLIRFTGRFGVKKTVMLPVEHGSFTYVHWAWVDTNAGEIPILDLGLILVPTNEKWYRVFPSKGDAVDYYQS
jgi:hypothetical protein